MGVQPGNDKEKPRLSRGMHPRTQRADWLAHRFVAPLEPGSSWNVFPGRCERVTIGDQRPRRSSLYWFAWVVFHPDIAVYQAMKSLSWTAWGVGRSRCTSDSGNRTGRVVDATGAEIPPVIAYWLARAAFFADTTVFQAP